MSSARPMPDTGVGWQYQTATSRPSTASYGINPGVSGAPTLIITASSNNGPSGGDTGYMEINISNVAVSGALAVYFIELHSNTVNDPTSPQPLHYRGQNTSGGAFDPENKPKTYISSISGTSAANAAADGIWYHFPLTFPLHYANSTHDVGVWDNNEANGRVYISFNSRFVHPEYFPTGQSLICYFSANSTGGPTTVTEGTTSDGSWFQMSNILDATFPTVVEAWHWQLGIEMSHAGTSGDRIIAVDFAYGNSTVKTMVIEDFMFTTTTTEQVAYSNPWVANIRVPAGSNLYCRAQSSGAVNAAFFVYAYGVVG